MKKTNKNFTKLYDENNYKFDQQIWRNKYKFDQIIWIKEIFFLPNDIKKKNINLIK